MNTADGKRNSDAQCAQWRAYAPLNSEYEEAEASAAKESIKPSVPYCL